MGACDSEYLQLGGFIGLQQVSGAPGSFVLESTLVAGQSCSSGVLCSYRCPAGMQKTQFPTQSSGSQSMGGLYCDANNKLQLTNPAYNTLCMQGVGNVVVKNNLQETVAMCRTDYPGTEGETVPLGISAGSTQPVCSPDSDYFIWEGLPTTAQWYLNNQGVSVSTACQWGSTSSAQGNYAPMNLGTGRNSQGETFIGFFKDHPSCDMANVANPCVLNYDVTIVVDGTPQCSYSSSSDSFSGPSYANNACTIAVLNGQTATVYLGSYP